MKFKLLLSAVLVPLLLLVLATAVIAQGEPPAPYSGLKSPFPWGDASAQQAGKDLYQQSCLGCHGIKGNNLAVFDFSASDFPQHLEERPDFYFWVVSEGRLAKGMPGYKSSLSEEERWQILNYIWSLGAPSAEETAVPTPISAEEGGTLMLVAPQQAQSGEPMTLQVTVQDIDGRPVGRATVEFFLKVDFFTSGLMEIGKTQTDQQGIAIFEYIPRQTGDIQLVARYQAVEAMTTINFLGGAEHFYEAEAGVELQGLGPDILWGPKSATDLGETMDAPATAFRLPGGILSWLLVLVVTVMFIWFTYFRVMYQVFRMPIVSEIQDIDTRAVPLVGLTIVALVGILLAAMLLTGPYSHLNLPRW